MASRVKITIDSEQLRNIMEQVPLALNARLAQSIQTQVIIKMKQLIAKGISPIDTHGRFPAYKSAQTAAKGKAKKAEAKELGKKSKKGKALQSESRGLIEDSKKQYPLSVQSQFPQKKSRPVNLELSGEFLENLKGITVGTGSAFQVDIQVDGKFAKYEQGHREEANGQGFRPIIPQDAEDFVPSIRIMIDRLVSEAVKLYFKK